MTNVNIIAIDGPAASGKGTLSRSLASYFGYAHLDTGALYRAVGFEVLKSGGDPATERDAVEGCTKFVQKLKVDPNVLENGALREDTIAVAASKVAACIAVREMLVQAQRDFADNPPNGALGAVLDGRDIGTVICPHAKVKLYVTAAVEIRAERRMKELHSKGISVTYEAVLEDMRARDARDSGRSAAPLKPAEDAIVIDSSHLDAAQMLEIAKDHAIKAYGR